MTAVTDIIRKHRADILRLWKENAERAASARGLSSPAFTNVMPVYLASLADRPDSPGEQARHIESHLATRLRQGFDLAEIQDEFLILGRCVARFWEDEPAERQPSPADLERLHTNLQFAAVAVTRLFEEHMQHDEQREKRFLRELQSIADDSLRSGRPPLIERLEEVARLVMEATGAQSAAILLLRADTQELVTSATAGVASEELARVVTGSSTSSFHGAVAASDEATQVSDAATTSLEVSDALRHSGIHSLLGIRLPPHHDLLGIMYVGLTEQRPYSAGETRRLEALGERLTMLLENARLYADLRARVAELGQERELRDRFVSILAHDLRGPLSAAKLGAHALAKRPEALDDRRTLAVQIERGLDRMDRMIRDLLDVNRVRAGQRLPLQLEECDLGSVAEQVVDEARLAHGDARVVLQSALEHGEPLRGFWSEEELRRALWNLVTNGLKYGAPDRPVVVRVERGARGARVSVHNEGNPIAAEHQERIFGAYERNSSEAARFGWGLGLTLVRACAEAHGGSVVVSSSAEEGTTFTIELPFDARPFQGREGGRLMHDGTPRETPSEGHALPRRSSMRCDEVMTREVQSVRQRDTVLAAAKLMRHANVGFLPVSDDDGRIVGALTDRDIVVRLAADGRDWHTLIGDVMTAEVVSCHPADPLETAERLMRVHHTARVVCVDEDGRARGIVSVSDVARNESPAVAIETLREVVTRQLPAG